MESKKRFGVRSSEFGAINPHSARSLPSNVSIGGTPHSKGFTLVEIVITIVLIGIISGIAVMIILQGVKAYSDEQSRSDVHYQARLAVERTAREIRLVRSATAGDITTMTATNLQFNDINGNNIQFQRIGGAAPYSITRNGLVLANDIQSVAISYYQNDGITAVTPATVTTLWFVDISVTAQKGAETIQTRTRVHPMNF